MKLKFTALSLLLVVSPIYSLLAQVQSPAEFLGYEIGERWTPHHQIVKYVEHVADESELVVFEKYGTTNELRDLVYLIVTSEENHQNLEEIRTNNLKITGILDGDITENQKGVVWLSYNIHGNEASSSEAAMLTLYELVRDDRQDTKKWLENTVVIIDPAVNPDGRDRYVNWFNQMRGINPDPSADAREHREPWPGGRPNHYLFDLNRDWAWQVQVESQQRYEIYSQWFPQIHVDYHEQGASAPYYFAPAAEPMHEAITGWQREFQTMIGENHISYFDENSWLYFTKERFDLFYPSYGDTWPTFHGAIGMTYEMPGHGFAGLALERATGDTLTLKQRATQHFTTGISTVETASVNSERMIEEFKTYFDIAQNNPEGQYKTFVISAENSSDKLYSLLDDLDKKHIQYGKAGSSRSVNGFNFSTASNENFTISEDDIIVSAAQPQGNLVRVLFEPDPALSDSLTYDITAWEAHYRFGLNGFALEESFNPQEEVEKEDYLEYGIDGSENPYAYIMDWGSMYDANFLAEIINKGVKARFSEIPFEIDGREYKAGTLLLLRKDNINLSASFDQTVREAAQTYQRKLYGSSTGYVAQGSDFGSSNIRFMNTPKVAILMGDGTSSLNAGEIWHYFDHQLDYPATLINTDNVSNVDISTYDVIVLPSGAYRGTFNGGAMEELSAWVRNGGTLITFGQANSMIAGNDGFQLQRKTREDSNDETGVEEQLQPYADRGRSSATYRTPGSIFKVNVDNTHPLGFGYSDEYFSLKSSADAFSYLDSGWNVGSVQEDAHRSGFAGAEARKQLEHTLSFGVQNYGRGQVVYFVDNPLFRGFWENGKLLVANAIFFVPN